MVFSLRSRCLGADSSIFFSNDDALILCHGTFILMLLVSVAHEEHGGLVDVLTIVILAQVP